MLVCPSPSSLDQHRGSEISCFRRLHIDLRTAVYPFLGQHYLPGRRVLSADYLGKTAFYGPMTSRVYDTTCEILAHILGAFAKLRKATLSFVIAVCLSVRLSVCPSVCMEKLGSHWTGFDKI